MKFLLQVRPCQTSAALFYFFSSHVQLNVKLDCWLILSGFQWPTRHVSTHRRKFTDARKVPGISRKQPICTTGFAVYLPRHFRFSPASTEVLSKAVYVNVIRSGESFLTLLTKFPVLRQIFQETWPKYKTKFGPIIDNLKQHKQLVEGRITFTQLEMAIGNGQKALEELDTQRRSNENIQHRAVRCWLNSADVQVDQESASSVLFTNDKAGKWLIQHHLFQAWQDFDNKDSLLWLTGIPGAGRCFQSEKTQKDFRFGQSTDFSLPSSQERLFSRHLSSIDVKGCHLRPRYGSIANMVTTSGTHSLH